MRKYVNEIEAPVSGPDEDGYLCVELAGWGALESHALTRLSLDAPLAPGAIVESSASTYSVESLYSKQLVAMHCSVGVPTMEPMQAGRQN